MRLIQRITNSVVLLSIFFGLVSIPAYPQNLHGATVDELRRNIEAKNAQIEALNKEIKELDSKIQETAQEGKTLKGAISTLDTSKNKLVKEINVTENQVDSTSLNIEKIGIEIGENEKKIQRSRIALADSIRNLKRAEDLSLVESILQFENISELWNQIENFNQYHISLQENMSSVETLKAQLSEKKAETEKQKKELLDLKAQLEDQKKIVEINTNEKAKLLSETQSKEANYKKQLEDKVNLSQAFLNEISAYESQLRFIIDPNSYPQSGKGILSWPLEKIIVTQEFGDTAFARTNAYNGKGHTGVDFGASRGTKVMSAQSGVVSGVGDTGEIIDRVTVTIPSANIRSSANGTLIGTQPSGRRGSIVGGPTNAAGYTWWKIDFDQPVSGREIDGWVANQSIASTCYSYGKWIMVKHDNGLSTLYAHLDLIKVTVGQRVSLGETIGYSGNTGYSTGPHLHFSVYATQGVRIEKFSDSINCKNAIIPQADWRAYLNPLLYL